MIDDSPVIGEWENPQRGWWSGATEEIHVEWVMDGYLSEKVVTETLLKAVLE